MTEHERYLNRILNEHDRELFVRKNSSGVCCVFRKGKRFLELDLDGAHLSYLIDSPQYVFALTDTWAVSGQPVPWGAEVILARLKALDLWNHETALDEIEEQNERVEKSKERDFSNNVESFAYEFRRDFAKATDHINTSSLDKSEAKRRKRDKAKELAEKTF